MDPNWAFLTTAVPSPAEAVNLAPYIYGIGSIYSRTMIMWTIACAAVVYLITTGYI